MTNCVIVRGAGDLATGTIVRLVNSGFRVLLTECAQPSAIRRCAALSEAVYDGVTTVEGVTCRKIDSLDQMEHVWQNGEVPLIVDETGESIRKLNPTVVVDAILAKRNLGTTRDMACITVALGPGFTAGEDVDAVTAWDASCTRALLSRIPVSPASSAAMPRSASFTHRQTVRSRW